MKKGGYEDVGDEEMSFSMCLFSISSSLLSPNPPFLFLGF
jgi:hypothetical protein